MSDPSIPDGFRGDPSNPVHQFERELYDLVERYADVRLSRPAWFVAYFLELADSYREADDVDMYVDDLGGGVYQVRVGDEIDAVLNAPRKDEYGEIDAEALAEKVEIPTFDGPAPEYDVEEGPYRGTVASTVDPDDPDADDGPSIAVHCRDCGGIDGLLDLDEYPTSPDAVDDYSAECSACGGTIVAEVEDDT